MRLAPPCPGRPRHSPKRRGAGSPPARCPLRPGGPNTTQAIDEGPVHAYEKPYRPVCPVGTGDRGPDRDQRQPDRERHGEERSSGHGPSGGRRTDHQAEDQERADDRHRHRRGQGQHDQKHRCRRWPDGARLALPAQSYERALISLGGSRRGADQTSEPAVSVASREHPGRSRSHVEGVRCEAARVASDDCSRRA